MSEKFEPGARVTHIMTKLRRATVVVRPLKLTHAPDCTPIVQDGDQFVTFWDTKHVRVLTSADAEPGEPGYLAELRRNEKEAGKYS